LCTWYDLDVSFSFSFQIPASTHDEVNKCQRPSGFVSSHSPDLNPESFLGSNPAFSDGSQFQLKGQDMSLEEGVPHNEIHVKIEADDESYNLDSAVRTCLLK
jgi:hypothetical protein